MKVRILLLALNFIALNAIYSQTVIFSENWTGGGAGWTLNVVTGPEGADPNFWKVSAEEGGGITPNLGSPGSCGVANNGNNTLFVTSVANPTGGAAYDAGGLCGVLFCPQADRRTESPTINCTGQNNLSLNFNYIEGGQGLIDNATVWFNDGTGWIQIDDPPKTLTGCGGQGLWVSRSFLLPASANNNPNVHIAFRWVNNDDGIGTDPSFAVDDITITVPTGALPVVSITPSPNDTICRNATLTLNGSATNGPITAWAWSVNPSAGVVFNPNASAQNPTVTFTTPGNYTFTLQATNGSGSATGTQTIVVLPMVTPSAVVTGPVSTVCAGTNICFTVTPTNGGSAPTYQWQVNGVNTVTTAGFCSSTLNNNDVVSCIVTSNAQCLTTNTTVATFTVQIAPVVVPSVTIAASTTVACAGTAINFTATPTNGGTTPVYQWQVNGSNVGSNSPNYSSTTLNNGDAVTVVLTSNNACANPVSATSNTITVAITPTVVPTATITANPGNPICAGTTVNFTATPTNGGTTPIYQWQVNGVNTGINSANFSSSTLVNNDVVSVIVTSNASCVSPSTVTATYTIHVSVPVTPSVIINPNPASSCLGGSITFTATPTNGGGVPAYQWQVNGVNAGTNSNTFTLSPVAAGQSVSVVLTSNAGCVTSTTANSSTVTITITPPPAINLIKGTATVCPNAPDTIVVTAPAGSTFTWTPSAGLNVTNNDTVVAVNAVSGIHTYYVTATLNGCSSKDSVKVTVNSSLAATTGPTQTICLGKSANLSVNGGTTWAWSPAGSLSCSACQNPVSTPTATTTYTVVASSGACTDILTQTVIVIPKASASFNTSVITAGIPQTIGFTNTSSNANNFFWTLGNGNTSVLQTPANQTYNAAGNYTVTLIAYGTNGCNDTINTVISVNDTVGITVPNVFTPNGDQINDVWQPNAHGAKTFECTIFNRWGLLIYDFLSSQDKWDGHTISGEACTEGTYYYILKATDANGKAYNLKGFIQLIR
ncbi:MAG TPA: gliding motility-associated C-terminal domain-containing protein [Bacteroidia bacterium]|jgi:gliding motility-associated-like protein|nr:gliding motility-associated C-terminal domain-containing protein [Bacteroidia bacterium]